MIKLKQLDEYVTDYYEKQMVKKITAKLKKLKIKNIRIPLKKDNTTVNLNEEFLKSLLTEKIFSAEYKYKNIIDDYMEVVASAEKDELIRLNKKIKKIINYKYITTKIRHAVLCTMEVDCCPYCNRHFLAKYEDEKSKKSEADIDHFYPQSKYALFALSLYNMIPACQTCNQRLKLATDVGEVKIVYPYEEEFGEDAKFAIVNKDNDKWLKGLLGDELDVEIKLSVSPTSEIKDKICNSIKIFKIDKIYKSHNSYACSILRKKYIYNNEHKEYIKKILSNISSTNNYVSDAMVNSFLYGYTFELDEPRRKILAKLTKDLIM